MKRNWILSLMVALVGMCSMASAQEEPRRADGRNNIYYYIYGAQPTPEVVEKYHFIMAGDLTYTTYADSYYTLVFPGSGVLCAFNKPIIKDLFPEVKEYKLNGKTVTEAEFDAVPGQLLTKVSFADGVLTAESSAEVNDDNPYREKVMQETLEWLKANANNPMPANVALNDPDTYFEDPKTIVTLDFLITTPAKVKEKLGEVKGFVMYMNGNPQIYAITNDESWRCFNPGDEYIGGFMSSNIEDIKGPLTPANIAAQLHLPEKDLFLLVMDSKQIKAFLRK